MKELITIFIFFGLSINSFSSVKELSLIRRFDITQKKINSFKLRENIKGYVFYFLNGRCPCSQSHFSHLNSLQKKYSDFDFVGFHSNKNMNKEMAIEKFSKFNISFPIFIDQDLKYANILKAAKTPHVFVLNMKGDIVYQGGATNSRNPNRASKFYLRDALESMNLGQKPLIKIGKILGCYIER